MPDTVPNPPAPEGAPTPTPLVPPTPPTPAPTPPVLDEPLGEPGKKALDAERRARSEAEREAKATKDELDKLRQQQMTDQERAVEEAKSVGKAEATEAFRRQSFADRVAVAATGKLADPDLLADPDVALKLLGFSEIPVTDGGTVDTEAISGAVAGLLEAKPYLKAGGATPHDPGLGPRGGAPKDPSLDEQIIEAQKAGDVRRVIALQNQRLLPNSPK